MLAIDFLVMIGALIFFFLRAASDADEDERVPSAASRLTVWRGSPQPAPGPL